MLAKSLSDSHYYTVVLEQFRIVWEDQFELLKDPRRLFQERVQIKTPEVLMKRFEGEHNSANWTTDHLPWRDISMEVDNEVYEQYAKIVTVHSAFQSLDFE